MPDGSGVSKWALVVALTALSAALGWIAVQTRTMATLEAANSDLTGNVAALEVQQSRAVAAQQAADAAAAQARARAAALQLRVETVLTTTYGGCADAPIDPDLLDDLTGWDVPAPR